MANKNYVFLPIVWTVRFQYRTFKQFFFLFQNLDETDSVYDESKDDESENFGQLDSIREELSQMKSDFKTLKSKVNNLSHRMDKIDLKKS